MTTKTPKHYRSFKDHRIGWEIYSRRTFFISISVGNLELQINRWGKTAERALRKAAEAI